MDHFKEYNDSLGHLTGDQILKDFADSLQQDDDRIISCRFGGDEFICICVDCNEQMIISFIEQVYSKFELYGYDKITISSGYYNSFSNCLSKEELIMQIIIYIMLKRMERMDTMAFQLSDCLDSTVSNFNV